MIRKTWQNPARQYGTAAITLLVFLAFALLWAADQPAYNALIRATTAIPIATPFSDFRAVLQAGLCWRQGVDVYAPSPCMAGGVYNYSPFLLRFAYLPISIADTGPGGWIIDLSYIAGLALLPAPQSALDFLARTAAAISTAAIYALQAANIDIIMFTMSVFAVSLLSRSAIHRLCAYGIFTFLAALKFYPVFALVLALRERRKNLLCIAAAGIICGAVFLLVFASGVKTAYNILPSGLPFTWLFGAIDLPFGIALLKYMPVLTLNPDLADYNAALADPNALRIVAYGLKALAIIAVASAIILARYYHQASQDRQAPLIAGAAVIVGCFALAQNLDHRAIFLILAIPALAEMAAASVLPKLLIGAILLLMCESLFRLQIAALATAFLPSAQSVYPQIAFWLLRELLWWFVIIQLLAILFAFVWSNLKRLAAAP